jgi:uncharacterized membrane protein
MKKIFFGLVILIILGFIGLTLIKMPAPSRPVTKEVKI